MARANINAQQAPGSIDYDGVVLSYTACDATNFNETSLTGREMLIVKNTSADTAYDFTIESIADALGRTKDIFIEIPFGVSRMFGPMKLAGWKQSGGKLFFKAENLAIQVAVVRV